MKNPLNTVNTSTSQLLTHESNSLTHALSSPNDAFPHAPPYANRFELVDAENSANYDVEDGEDDDDDVEERENNKLMRRHKLAEGFFEVEAIRKKRISKGVSQYLIKWRGWPESANTWEPVDHLQTCPDVVEAYEESLQSGHKKNSSKRKRKFTQQKNKTPLSGPTKTKILRRNGSPNSATLDNSTDAHLETSMIDIVVKHDGALKTSRSTEKVDQNDPQTVSPSVVSSENNHSDPVQLSDQNASLRNSDVHLQQPMNVGGDDPSNQLTKPTHVEGQSSQRKGARRRKSGSVRRFTQDVTSLNIDCFGTPSPVNESTSEGVEQLNIGSSVVFRKKRSDSSRSITITKIIKPISYSTSITNDAHDVSVTFVVMRSDGKEVMVDNNYLKSTNPHLLINFYEQHLRYNPT